MKRKKKRYSVDIHSPNFSLFQWIKEPKSLWDPRKFKTKVTCGVSEVPFFVVYTKNL